MFSPERASDVSTSIVNRARDLALAAVVANVTSFVAAPVVVLAASPTPSPLGGGDPRSSGSGPGLVGDPLAAILIVLAIAVLSALATLAYVRLTDDRSRTGSS